MNWLLGYVDPLDPYFVAAVLTIAFNPLFWNVVSALALTLSERLYRQTDYFSFPLSFCGWHEIISASRLGDTDQGSPSPWGSDDILADGPGLHWDGLGQQGWLARGLPTGAHLRFHSAV